MNARMMVYQDPETFDQLPSAQQSQLLEWIKATFCVAKRPAKSDSYGLKHAFEQSKDGFYLTNGQFKGAMLRAGFPPLSKREEDWRFRIRRVGCSGRLEAKAPYGYVPCYHLADILTGLCPYHRNRALSHLREDPNRPETREEWRKKMDARRGL